MELENREKEENGFYATSVWAVLSLTDVEGAVVKYKMTGAEKLWAGEQNHASSPTNWGRMERRSSIHAAKYWRGWGPGELISEAE